MRSMSLLRKDHGIVTRAKLSLQSPKARKRPKARRDAGQEPARKAAGKRTSTSFLNLVS
eukprot:COSAG03_NODE_6777_length_1007_cov_1.008811_1_plen_58_part_10